MEKIYEFETTQWGRKSKVGHIHKTEDVKIRSHIAAKVFNAIWHQKFVTSASLTSRLKIHVDVNFLHHHRTGPFIAHVKILLAPIGLYYNSYYRRAQYTTAVG